MVYARMFAGYEAHHVEQPRLNTSQYGSPIQLVTETGQAVQISVHQRPTSFMAQNLERVFPDWVLPVTTCRVVVVLQQSRYPLAETAPHIEREKDRLRERFISFGCDVARALQKQGVLADLIDPRDGYLLFSRKGEIPHNDTAVVNALLGLPLITEQCSVLTHPSWDTAVYPGILMSSASPRIMKPVLKKVAARLGWTALKPKIDVQLSIAGVSTNENSLEAVCEL